MTPVIFCRIESEFRSRTIFLYFVKGLKTILDWGANTPDMCPDISIKPSFSGVREHAMCGAFPPHRIHLNPAGKRLQTWLVRSAHSKNIHLVKENTGLWGTNWEEFDPQYKGVFQRGGEEGGRKSWSQEEGWRGGGQGKRGMLESEWEIWERQAQEWMRREQWRYKMKMGQNAQTGVL